MRISRPSTLLRRIASKINKNTWTQGTCGRTAEGEEVNGHDPKAVKFCAIGFCQRFTSSESGVGLREEALSFLKQAIKTDEIINFNDSAGRKASEVRAAFLKASKLAKKAGR